MKKKGGLAGKKEFAVPCLLEPAWLGWAQSAEEREKDIF